MSKTLLVSVFLAIVGAFVTVWLFEPTIHYYESVNVNTMGSDDFTMTDRHSDKEESRTVGISIVVPAYNEVIWLW